MTVTVTVKDPRSATGAMSYAPDGRVLSPGEVYEAPSLPKTDEEWREDLNVTLMCPDCRENGMPVAML